LASNTACGSQGLSVLMPSG